MSYQHALVPSSRATCPRFHWVPHSLPLPLNISPITQPFFINLYSLILTIYYLSLRTLPIFSLSSSLASSPWHHQQEPSLPSFSPSSLSSSPPPMLKTSPRLRVPMPERRDPFRAPSPWSELRLCCHWWLSWSIEFVNFVGFVQNWFVLYTEWWLWALVSILIGIPERDYTVFNILIVICFRT